MSVPLPHRLAAEGLGTAILVFFGPGAAVISEYLGGSLTLEGMAACSGLVVLVLVYSLGHVSGAHFNPAVTLGFTLFRHFRREDVLPYWLAQVAGAIVGAALLLALVGKVHNLGATVPRGSDTQALAFEIVLSFLLMFVITAVATDSRAVGQAAAIAIGATVGLDILIGGPISGASMNPARSLGPAIVSGELSSIWVYIVGPSLGAVFGAFAYTMVRGDHE
jgi:aquaporin NIP